eukprot:COSAG02_NODE_343_length_24147_cov_30.662051_19_plen_165_part_00
MESNADLAFSGGRVEDPSEPWQDERGGWHVLFHAESPSGAPWPRAGGHAFSCAPDPCLKQLTQPIECPMIEPSNVFAHLAMDLTQQHCNSMMRRHDGRHWTYTGTAFNTTVQFSDGSTEVFKRRERPHVIFADPNRATTPTHLSTGVVYGPADACFTLIQPIAA